MGAQRSTDVAAFAGARAPKTTETPAWLERAAVLLGLPGVPGVMREALREALPWPWGDPRYGSNALIPGRPPLEVSFVEDDPGLFRLDFEPAPPGTAPARRLERGSEMVRQWAREGFAPAVVSGFERSLDLLCRPPLGAGAVFGAFLGASCDERGIAEAKIYRELDGGIPEGFPSSLIRVARAALEGDGAGGLAPHLAALACARERCIPRIYFLCREEMPLFGLRPALAAAGLEHRLPEWVSLAALFLGADLTLPAGSAVLSFRDDAGTLDCKLEFFARASRQSRESLACNLLLFLSERPTTRSALHRWTRALGEDGALPEMINVVGLRASRGQPSSFGLYASPSKWSGPCPR
jgi:hypothetical protein